MITHFFKSYDVYYDPDGNYIYEEDDKIPFPMMNFSEIPTIEELDRVFYDVRVGEILGDRIELIERQGGKRVGYLKPIEEMNISSEVCLST